VCQRTNRKGELGDKAFGHRTAGLFDYTHLTGGYLGGQAEYLRVPFAHKQGLIRAYGVRELASAVPTLSIDRLLRLAARIGGDALNLGTLATALHRDNPKCRNAAIATAMAARIAVLDLAAYAGIKAAHRRDPADAERDYSGRSGLPKGSRRRAVSRKRTSGSRPTIRSKERWPRRCRCSPHKRAGSGAGCGRACRDHDRPPGGCASRPMAAARDAVPNLGISRK
jgi:hypothetical protein